MIKLTRIPALTFAAVVLVTAAANARAQATGITISAPKTSRTSVESGEVATMAFTVRNSSKDTAIAEPKVVVPTGWRVVMGPASTVIAPGEQDIWLVSVKSPANGGAGDYNIRVEAGHLSTASKAVSEVKSADSVVISIAERHGVAVRSLGSPSYVMGGESYEARFLVQNLGNVAARFDVTAKSTQGSTPLLAQQVVALAPGQFDTIKASVVIPKTITMSVEEMLLISAIDVAVDSVRAEASMQSTVVPAATTGPSMWTVPTEIAIRTATPGSGVSAFTASGYGKLTETSDVMVDFMLRGPTGKTSMFGEQETYRVGLRSHLGSLRLGDDSYGFSRLLTSGGRGTGAELMTERKGLVGGAYVQHDRISPNGGTEMGAMVGTDESRDVSGSVVAVNRFSKGGSAQAISLGTNALIAGARLGVELAASDSQHLGAAGRLRLNGDSRLFSYDLSAQNVSGSFASSQQGSATYRAAATAHNTGTMTLGASTLRQETKPGASLDGFGQTLSTSTVNASWSNGISAEVEHFARKDVGGISSIAGHQESARLRGRLVFGAVDATLSMQTGLARQVDSAARASLNVGGSLNATLRETDHVSVFADFGNGRGLAESGNATVTAGVNTDVHAAATTLRLMSYMTRAMATGAVATQTDVSLEQEVRQYTLALRARLATSPVNPSTHAVFLEVRTPIGLPTSPVNPIGRARAEVIDAETGRGVAGALVRLGGHAAVTDANGIAMFRDLKAGKYRALVDGAAVAGRVVASGGEVSISATSRKPESFSMSLSRGAQLIVRLRSFERTSAVIANGGDTLTEVGAVGQVVVALVTSTDTLWQTSDERGRVDFGAVAPGRYTVAIPRYDAPDHMAFAKTEFTVEVGAGEQRAIDFKLIPQVRAIEFQGEAVLIAKPAGAAKPAAAGQTTITGKPETNPITGKPDQTPITTKPDQTPITTKPSSPSAPIGPVTLPARGQRQNQGSQGQGRNQ